MIKSADFILSGTLLCLTALITSSLTIYQVQFIEKFQPILYTLSIIMIISAVTVSVSMVKYIIQLTKGVK